MVSSAAHFVICEDCGGHGHIVFSDGSTSAECCSIAATLIQIEWGIAQDLMQEDEASFLRSQVSESSLARSIGPVDLTLAALDLAVSTDFDLSASGRSAKSNFCRGKDSMN